MKRSAIAITFALLGVALTACAAEDRDTGALTLELVGVRDDASFSDAVPAEFQTVIRRGDQGRRNVTTLIDASDHRSFFPIPRNLRSFSSRAEMIEYAVDTLGAEGMRDSETGEYESLRFAYSVSGVPIFENALGIRYRVRDPLLAMLGGASGRVEIAGESVCIDPDGECDEEAPSYLEPEGELTAATHVSLCGSNGVCVQFHAFYNKTAFLFYARHGSNVAFTTYSALPSTQLSTGGNFYSDSQGTRFLTWTTNQGQDSVESAVSSMFSDQTVEYLATEVCGVGQVSDQDVGGTRRTGNGPGGWSCPS